jgi:alkylresorcinol/alkylpyrone synthase
MQIAAVRSAFPPHVYDQATLAGQLSDYWRERPEAARRIGGLHGNARVEQRHLVLPRERYSELADFGAFNDAWIGAAVDLGAEAVSSALRAAGIANQEVDAIFFTTVTGIASPSIDARLVNRLGLRGDVKRTPLFGLGCVAGVAALARAADYLRAFPDQVAVVLSVELCSLTWQRDDTSLANLVASGLFGDGAAAVVLVGAQRGGDGPRIVDSRASFYPDTEDVMGWKVGADGFRIVLGPQVPAIARELVPRDVEGFLALHRLTRADISRWICHPGGPRVLEALRDGLQLTDDDVAHAWESLRTRGNLSSASVLCVLEATLAAERPARGRHGLMLALGPGFCSELVLLAW